MNLVHAILLAVDSLSANDLSIQFTVGPADRRSRLYIVTLFAGEHFKVIPKTSKGVLLLVTL